jgi:hypothetical protein
MGRDDYSVEAIPDRVQAGFPGSLRLCAGESAGISVYIKRLVYGGGPVPIANTAAGGQVWGRINDVNIGHWDGYDADSDTLSIEVYGAPHPSAHYTFVADAPGQTTLEFGIEALDGEDLDVLITDTSISVEVTYCFEAVTSGLGRVFTKASMGDLIDPFTLASETPPTAGITTDSQNMFFLPLGGGGQQVLPALSGVYVIAIIDTTTLAGQTVTCVNVLNGPYEVEFRVPPDDSRFRNGVDVGELLLYGGGSKFCSGRHVLSVQYIDEPGFRISFTPSTVR